MDSTLLYWAARRYLTDRYRELTAAYSKLPGEARAAGRDDYALEAKRIFPRYYVVQAILVEVERLDSDRLPDVKPVTAALVHAAHAAQSGFSQAGGDVEAEAMADERRRFRSAVLTWTSSPDLQAAPLAYRRVLTTEESAHWRALLAGRWGVWHDSWYPMLPDPVPAGVLVLDERAMWEGPGVDLVRRAVVNLGSDRVAELRELETDYLLDAELFAPRYTAAGEGIWTDRTLDWIAYASHHGTVAFGGSLAAELPVLWHDLDMCRWPGWQRRCVQRTRPHGRIARELRVNDPQQIPAGHRPPRKPAALPSTRQPRQAAPEVRRSDRRS